MVRRVVGGWGEQRLHSKRGEIQHQIAILLMRLMQQARHAESATAKAIATTCPRHAAAWLRGKLLQGKSGSDASACGPFEGLGNREQGLPLALPGGPYPASLIPPHPPPHPTPPTTTPTPTTTHPLPLATLPAWLKPGPPLPTTLGPTSRAFLHPPSHPPTLPQPHCSPWDGPSLAAREHETQNPGSSSRSRGARKCRHGNREATAPEGGAEALPGLAGGRVLAGQRRGQRQRWEQPAGRLLFARRAAACQAAAQGVWTATAAAAGGTAAAGSRQQWQRGRRRRLAGVCGFPRRGNEQRGGGPRGRSSGQPAGQPKSGWPARSCCRAART